MKTLYVALLVNICIVGIVGLAIYATHNLWAFLGLLFLMGYEGTSKCPNCGYDFKDKK